MADSGYIKVAQVSDLKTGEMIAVTIGDDQVLLSNIEGTFHAIDDVCSHAYACLSDGDIDGEEVACPLHGGSFNAIRYTSDKGGHRSYFQADLSPFIRDHDGSGRQPCGPDKSDAPGTS